MKVKEPNLPYYLLIAENDALCFYSKKGFTIFFSALGEMTILKIFCFMILLLPFDFI